MEEVQPATNLASPARLARVVPLGGSHGYRLSLFKLLVIELKELLPLQPWSSELFLFPSKGVCLSASTILAPLA